MKKSRLVEELRYNLLDWDGMTPETIARMSDAEVIEKFTTCPECGIPAISRRDRKAAIKEAKCGLEFLQLCGWELCREDGDTPARLGHGHPTLN